jgi:HTH-type transcriptional regulator/antitoxin HipB
MELGSQILCAAIHKTKILATLHIYNLCRMTNNSRMSDLARDSKQIGALIRRARKKRSWSQQQLGAAAGLRQETVSVIENGHPAARIDTLLSLLAALDLEFQIAPRSQSTDWNLENHF